MNRDNSKQTSAGTHLPNTKTKPKINKKKHYKHSLPHIIQLAQQLNSNITANSNEKNLASRSEFDEMTAYGYNNA